MRVVTCAALAVACVYVPNAGAAEISIADRGAIDQVITAQIEAFRHDDGAAALRFATPGLQRQFGDGAHFLDIVRQDYPPVFRPRSFTFGDLEAADGQAIQKVELIGPDGAPATALYEMHHEADGSWRISGCTLVKSKQLEI
jgi:hypothetical protein